jgi:predicted DNA-binding protein (MmcQ/YjbR family)
MRLIADIRAACAALEGSRETFPFDATTLVFKVGGKLYALTSLTGDPVTFSLKVPPEHGETLRATHPAIVPGYHLNKRHWITVTLDGSVPDALLRDLLAGSHALVLGSLTRAQRADLESGG